MVTIGGNPSWRCALCLRQVVALRPDCHCNRHDPSFIFRCATDDEMESLRKDGWRIHAKHYSTYIMRKGKNA